MLNTIRKVGVGKIKPFESLWEENPITVPKIPALAQGGYVKANTPQLAMIGDNRHYGEVVSPEDKLQAMAVEAGRLAAESTSAAMVPVIERLCNAIIALETRLTEVRYQIQSMESQLRTYDNQVDYATITLSVEEVTIYTPDTQEPKSDLQRMTDGFVTSVKRVLQGIKNFLIDLVIALPYLLIWAVVIAAIVLVIRMSVKKSKKKRERKLAEKMEKLKQQSGQLNAAVEQVMRKEEETDKPES